MVGVVFLLSGEKKRMVLHNKSSHLGTTFATILLIVKKKKEQLGLYNNNCPPHMVDHF